MTTSDQNSPPRLRQQLFVAPKVQGRLLFRIMLYCILSSCVTACFYLGAQFMDPATSRWVVLFGPVVVAIVVVVPLVMYDAARTSNRFVGPIVRAHGAIRRLARRDVVRPIELRDADDSWTEWIQDFNAMVARLQSDSSEGDKA